MIETYAIRNSGRDGAAVLMAMLPALMVDDEFKEHLMELEKQYQLDSLISISRRMIWPFSVITPTGGSAIAVAVRICRSISTGRGT